MVRRVAYQARHDALRRVPDNPRRRLRLLHGQSFMMPKVNMLLLIASVCSLAAWGGCGGTPEESSVSVASSIRMSPAATSATSAATTIATSQATTRHAESGRIYD